MIKNKKECKHKDSEFVEIVGREVFDCDGRCDDEFYSIHRCFDCGKIFKRKIDNEE